MPEGMGDDERKKMSGGPVVCVTGGGGYIGSWLVRKLLARGCVVHATLRSLGTYKCVPVSGGSEGPC